MSPWKFHAAVLEQQKAPLKIQTLRLPAPAVGQVAVKVAWSGICGKQLVEQDGVLGPDPFLPHCLGHEGSGVVIGIGDGVSTVAPGDHVVLHWRPGKGIEGPFPSYTSLDGSRVGGGKVTTFQTHTIASENRVTRIPEAFPLDLAALLGCAVTTGLGLVSNEAGITMGTSVAVLGCGGVGLNVIQGCRMVSAWPVLGIDIHASKLEKAAAMGATRTLHNDPETLKPFSGKIDVVVDTTGYPDVAQAAIDLCRPGGKVFFVGQMLHSQSFPLNSSVLHDGKQLTASFGGGTIPDRDIPRYVKLYDAGLLDLRSLITHTCELGEINDMMTRIRQGEASRALIRMDD